MNQVACRPIALFPPRRLLSRRPLSRRRTAIRVSFVAPGSAAALADLRVDDILLAIDGRDLSSVTQATAQLAVSQARSVVRVANCSCLYPHSFQAEFRVRRPLHSQRGGEFGAGHGKESCAQLL